ncbi:MAG: Tat pathway signal sequence domain protein [Caulobacteraceae bacterium]
MSLTRRFALGAGALALGLCLASAGHAQYGQVGSQTGGYGGTRAPPSQSAAPHIEQPKTTFVPPPLPGSKNSGPCPYVKVLYDAARYQEFRDGRESASAVQYTGEINGIAADCAYRDADPIKLRMAVTFDLGRGPQADGDSKTYRYWVAVTRRNSAVLEKQWFDLAVDFKGQDRVRMRDEIDGIIIPRANKDISGTNFEVLVGFEVTPQMAAFNREGKRFRVDAGSASTQ